MMPDNKTSAKPAAVEYRVIADAIVNGKVKGEIVTFDGTVQVLPLLANGFIERITQEVK